MSIFSYIFVAGGAYLYPLRRVLGASGLTIEYVVATVKRGECSVCTVTQGEGIIAVEGSESREDLVVCAFRAVSYHVLR